MGSLAIAPRRVSERSRWRPLPLKGLKGVEEAVDSETVGDGVSAAIRRASSRHSPRAAARPSARLVQPVVGGALGAGLPGPGQIDQARLDAVDIERDLAPARQRNGDDARLRRPRPTRGRSRSAESTAPLSRCRGSMPRARTARTLSKRRKLRTRSKGRPSRSAAGRSSQRKRFSSSANRRRRAHPGGLAGAPDRILHQRRDDAQILDRLRRQPQRPVQRPALARCRESGRPAYLPRFRPRAVSPHVSPPAARSRRRTGRELSSSRS